LNYLGLDRNRLKLTIIGQGCQMAYFQTRNPYLGKFLTDLQWKMLVYFRQFGIFYGFLVYFVAILYSLWLFGIYFVVLVRCAKKNLATLGKFRSFYCDSNKTGLSNKAHPAVTNECS
jgi:hypothetical protein